MTCCPKPPEVKTGDSSDGEDSSIADTEMRPGETTECYLRRAGNPTGLNDDATAYPVDKIKTNDIPLSGGDTANTTFEMTPGSQDPTDWQIKSLDAPLPTSVEFTSNGKTATLIGKFPPDTYGQKFKVEVTVKKGNDVLDVLDVRSYVFSPAKATGSNDIRFVMPLPGGICSSPFSASRVHPVTGITKPHYGADFKMRDRSAVDVVAAADGEVVFTGFEAGGAGNYLKIQHLNAAGKNLCTTVYMHLSRIYVTKGQKVVAGQKVALEGSTGSSTGNHLHFECRLPNGDRVDPVPYIKGTTQVAPETTPSNEPKDGKTVPQTSDAALTPENVEAKQDGCEPFGDSYPKRDANDKAVADLVEPPPGSPFEKAWFFTMKNEVNEAWSQASPSDPEISAGLIETEPQRKKVGFVQLKGDTGGVTKFGISQNNNTKVKVREMAYDVAKKIGFNDYWTRYGAEDLATAKKMPKTAVLYFDICYLCGGGGAKSIKSKAGIDGMADDAAVEALAAAWQAHMRGLVTANPAKQRFIKGWLRRTEKTLAYAKSI